MNLNSNELFIEGDKLPAPLSKQEVYDLIKKINQGDKDARDKLIKHNIRLVLYKVSRKFCTVDYDKKELVSIGTIGLIKAVTTFDISKNVEFSTYASKCIDNEILMFLRKIKKDQKVDSLECIISCNKDDKKLKVEDTISDKTDIIQKYIDNETYQAIREIVNNLPDRDRKIIMLYFGFYDNKLYNQNEIAEIMSITQSNISRIITKNIAKIGQQLQEKGLIDIKRKK